MVSVERIKEYQETPQVMMMKMKVMMKGMKRKGMKMKTTMKAIMKMKTTRKVMMMNGTRKLHSVSQFSLNAPGD